MCCHDTMLAAYEFGYVLGLAFFKIDLNKEWKMTESVYFTTF